MKLSATAKGAVADAQVEISAAPPTGFRVALQPFRRVLLHTENFLL